MKGPSSSPGAGSSARADLVLVVDDDPELRESVQWLLQDEGLMVETAADGEQALERVAVARPALIVLDMGLPILSGEGFALELRARYPEPPPIVVLTADGRAAEKAERVGATAYLHKPFDVDDLTRLVYEGLRSP